MGKNKKNINEEPEEKIQESSEQSENEQETAEETKSHQTETEEDSIEKIRGEFNSLMDSYMRLAAEYDNFRKRTQNEKLAMYDDATAKAIMEILPVADSLDMAIQNSKDAPEQFLKGLEMVRNQLSAALVKLKVESFGEVGDEFNPELHNAISRIESEDFSENCISQVFQKGYKMSAGKVVRHAMVQVANCG